MPPEAIRSNKHHPAIRCILNILLAPFYPLLLLYTRAYSIPCENSSSKTTSYKFSNIEVICRLYAQEHKFLHSYIGSLLLYEPWSYRDQLLMFVLIWLRVLPEGGSFLFEDKIHTHYYYYIKLINTIKTIQRAKIRVNPMIIF